VGRGGDRVLAGLSARERRAKTLVVVESPAKAKTIKKYLGPSTRSGLEGAHQGPPQEARDRHRKGLQGDVRGRPGQGEGRPELKAAAKGATRSCWRPTPTARARPSPGTWPRSSSSRRRHQAGRVPRDHEEGRPVRRRPPPRARQEPLRRPARPPRPRPHRGVRRVGPGVEQARLRPRPGACRAWPCGSSSTASARSKRSSPRSTGTAGRALTTDQRRASLPRPPGLGKAARSSPSRTATTRPSSGPTSATRSTASRRSPRASASATRRLRTRRASSSRTPSTASASAPSARCRSPRASTRASTSARTAAAARSASSRTCAPTRRASRRTRWRRRASTSPEARQGVRPRAAQRLQVEEERAGRARGHPPDVARAHARERARAPEGRPVQALQDDLGALPREPDDARGLRPDERRHRGDREGQDVYGLRASGRILKFSGWLEAYGKGEIPKAAAPLAGEGEQEADGETPKKDAKEARDLLAEDAEATLPELDEGNPLRSSFRRAS
jgi:hypothetical protein